MHTIQNASAPPNFAESLPCSILNKCSRELHRKKILKGSIEILTRVDSPLVSVADAGHLDTVALVVGVNQP